MIPPDGVLVPIRPAASVGRQPGQAAESDSLEPEDRLNIERSGSTAIVCVGLPRFRRISAMQPRIPLGRAVVLLEEPTKRRPILFREDRVGKRWISGALTGVALVAVLTACGDSDENGGQTSGADVPAQSATAATGAQSVERTQAAAPAAAATTAPTPAGPQVIEIKSGDYYFEPKDVAVRPGVIAVQFANAGPERPHTFVVKNKDGNGDLFKSDRVAVNQSATLEFTVSEEGTYELYCSLPGHADRGQVGTLTVRGSVAATR